MDNMISENTPLDLSDLDPYYQAEFAKIIDSKEDYKGKWNWWAFFFVGLWALFKGCWVIAILSLFTVSFTLYRHEVAPGVYFIVSLPNLIWACIYGWRGTWFYYNVKMKKKQLPGL